MAFRNNESEQAGYQRAEAKLLGRYIDADKREESRAVLDDIVRRYGPVIESYPMWHPLVAAMAKPESSITTPGDNCGYHGLDHTIFFRNAIITCPYTDGQSVLDSVEQIAGSPFLDGVADISASRIEAQLYHANAHPILIQCDWLRPMASDGTVPAAIAVPLLLEKEVPNWRHAEVAETWETMAGYLLGRPFGSRSSLFVNQQTGQIIKSLWNSLIQTGMYGDIKIRA